MLKIMVWDLKEGVKWRKEKQMFDKQIYARLCKDKEIQKKF